jgi:O-succinylhomoserine sulfhydrylase
LTPEQKVQSGIADGLLRVSVGLENIRDIQHDLARGLGG